MRPTHSMIKLENGVEIPGEETPMHMATSNGGFAPKRQFSDSEPELMDMPDVGDDLMQRILLSLGRLNILFGARKELKNIFFRLIRNTPQLTVVDLASGFGDHGRSLIRRARKRHQRLFMIAVDHQTSTLRIARLATPNGQNVAFVQADARHLPFRPASVDVVFCTLALHHFSRGDARCVLSEMARIARRGVICLDLHRSWLAIVAIDFLARFILREQIVKHDASVSIRRAFDTNEMKSLGREAGWPQAHHSRFGWFQQALVGGLRFGAQPFSEK